MHGSDQCIIIENVQDNTTVDVQYWYSNRYGTKIRIQYGTVQVQYRIDLFSTVGTSTVVIQYRYG